MKIAQKLERHLEMLCEEIGERPTGSQANLEAVQYACREFEKYGLRVEQQNFYCLDWTKQESRLTVGDRVIPVEPAPYSLSCEIQGEIICVSSLEELRSAQIGGKLVLLCEALAAEALMPKGFVFWNPEEHKEIISLLETGKPLAVLTVSLSAERFVPVIEDGDFELPCGMILPESLPLLRDGTAAALQLRTNRRSVTASNCIAVYGNGKQKVCFSAHIDTKAGTKGALDNASGTAVLLVLASELSNREFPYRIEFVLFNGEDYYSNPGEMLYLSSQLSHPDEYVCAYNIDGVGRKGEKLSYSFYECPGELTGNISKLAEQFGEFEEIEPWPQGDHTLFSISGVPAISVTSSGIFDLADRVLHTEKDSLELVDIGKLEKLVNFLLQSI